MRTLCALMLTAVMVAPAIAQRPQGRGGFGGGFGGPMAILASEDVQKELKITDEQKTKIKDFQEKQQKAMADLRPPQGERPDPEKMREAMTKMREESTKFLKDTLTEDQNKRLQQISLQNSLKTNPAGAFGIGFQGNFQENDTTKALKLTDEQKEKIKSVFTKLNEDSRDLRPMRGQPQSEENRKKLEALRKEANEKVMEVLTDEQRKTLKDLQGEEFKGTIGAPGGRRPGAGGAPGTGGGNGGAGRRNRPAQPPADEKKPDEKKPDKKDG